MLRVLEPPPRQHLPYVTNKNCNDRARVSWEFREVQPDHTARDLLDGSGGDPRPCAGDYEVSSMAVVPSVLLPLT